MNLKTQFPELNQSQLDKLQRILLELIGHDEKAEYGIGNYGSETRLIGNLHHPQNMFRAELRIKVKELFNE
jgi:hypothetical protein